MTNDKTRSTADAIAAGIVESGAEPVCPDDLMHLAAAWIRLREQAEDVEQERDAAIQRAEKAEAEALQLLKDYRKVCARVAELENDPCIDCPDNVPRKEDADEIESLRARVAELEGALRELHESGGEQYCESGLASRVDAILDGYCNCLKWEHLDGKCCNCGKPDNWAREERGLLDGEGE